MAIKVGDQLPEGVLGEFVATERQGCVLGPNQFKVEEMVKGKKIAIFGLPGAFTPTCSAKHLPSYLSLHEQLKQKGRSTRSGVLGQRRIRHGRVGR